MASLDYQNRQDTSKETGFLRSMFGPSRKEVWTQLAEQVQGDFVQGGFLRSDKVVVATGQWTVTLDTYTVSHGESGSSTYTRMRAPYVNKDGFRFTIYRAGIFTAIGEALGMADINIGDEVFDKAFVIKANSDARVRMLLSDANIRRLMESQPRIRVEVKDDEGWFGARFPQGVDELYFVSAGVIKDLALLRGLFELFSALLHQLCHIGSAYENDPGIRL
jgi:hypothetical protein